jgi:lysozyme
MKPRAFIAPTWALAAALLLGLAGPGPSVAADVRAKPGIDVSRFQETVNWKRVGSTRTRFAILQASRGSGGDCAVVPERCGVDPFYRRNYRLARENDLRVGPYHRAFADGRTDQAAREDAKAEARLFSDEVRRLRRRDLIPTLDVESPFGSLDAERLNLWIEKWMRVVERRLDTPVMIYTNDSSWRATGNTTAFAEREVPLWVANFDVAAPLVPAFDWAGRDWSIWQYTSSGRIRGISGAVDKNLTGVRLRSLRVGRHRPPSADPPPARGPRSG